MRFYGLDQHISVCSDIKHIFNNLGHEYDIESISRHSWVMGWNKSFVPLVENNINQIVEKELWREYYTTNLSKLAGFTDYTGFIVTYPPIFSMLYREFNKPILIQIPIRYDHPYTDNDTALRIFNDFLKQDNVIPCANNALDKAYFEDRVGRECALIPSLCEYTGMKWNPKKEDFLLYDGSRRIQIENTINRYDMHPPTWNDIQSFKGIIHIPYQVSTMSFFEQYNAGIPLFYPSKEFLMEMYHGSIKCLDQCFWTRTQNGKYGFETMGAVIEHADYYSDDFPHVILFDSKADLEDKMYDDALLQWTHDQMMKDNEILRKKVYGKWQEILNTVNKLVDNKITMQ